LLGDVGAYNLNVVNETGVIVLKEKQQSNTSKTFDIHNWPKGVYIIQLSGKNEIYTKKICKTINLNSANIL